MSEIESKQAISGRAEERGSSDPEQEYRHHTESPQLQLQHEYQSLINKNEALLIGLRKLYGKTIVCFLWSYFAFTVASVSLSAIGVVSIDPLVLASIVGGTAASVLGVVGTVAAGLFRASK